MFSCIRVIDRDNCGWLSEPLLTSEALPLRIWTRKDEGMHPATHKCRICSMNALSTNFARVIE